MRTRRRAAWCSVGSYRASEISMNAKLPGLAAFTAARISASRGRISRQRVFPNTTIAIFRLLRFCWYWMFLSVVSNK